MSEKQKMLAGELYDSSDAELYTLRQEAHRICREYNEQDDSSDAKRQKLLDTLIPKHGKNLYLQGPIQFDYGAFTTMGNNVYANFNFTCLDCARVTIGNDVFFGPNVSILTPMHPIRWQERNQFKKPDGTLGDQEYAKPVTIGDNCWIAGNVTICGGVTIGEGSVIGAGSVVTCDIPANVVAVGNPCRVIKQIEN
ncbi:MAG: sugar O-acetyltransferase [Treponema sp.]|nr:sugar O-acetyltransferase [Treponema sp.]